MATNPTPRQLSYLRSLAERTGQTFTHPHTAPEASREIDRLKHVRPESHAERRIERKQIAHQLATGPADTTRVRDDEISGRGSNCHWSHNRHPEPQPTSDHPAPKRTTPVVGKRTELARYTVAEGERVVYGQRVDGVVRFLPGNLVVLVGSLGPAEDSTCRSRTTIRTEGRTNAVRRKRPNGASEPRCLAAHQREDWS